MDILLIRHARPEVSPSLPSSEWPLSVEGRAAAAVLAARLPSRASYVSSPERKAVETMRYALSQDQDMIAEDARFGEVRRDGEPFDGDVTARRLSWVEGRLDERHYAWERASEAAARFDRGVQDHLKDGEGRPLVISTHGMICTAWLVHEGRIQQGRAAGEFWSGLGFPDLIRVRLD